jgi:hypothetical protein
MCQQVLWVLWINSYAKISPFRDLVERFLVAWVQYVKRDVLPSANLSDICCPSGVHSLDAAAANIPGVGEYDTHLSAMGPFTAVTCLAQRTVPYGNGQNEV